MPKAPRHRGAAPPPEATPPALADPDPRQDPPPAAPPEPAEGRFDAFLRRRRRALGWAILLGAFFWFDVAGGHLNGGDTRALVDLAWWIGQGNAPRLNGHPAYRSGDAESFGYWAVEREDGQIAVVWPTGVVAFAAPVFRVVDALGVPVPASKAPLVAKLVASWLVAMTIGMAWLLLARTRGDREALAAAAALTFASPWATNLAQALWIQTGALWCQAASCLLLLPWLAPSAAATSSPAAKGSDLRPFPSRQALDVRIAAAGFFAGWAAVCRPQFALWTLLFAVFVFLRAGRREGIAALAGTAAAWCAGAWLASAASGSPWGLYGAKNAAEAPFDPNPLAWLGRAAGLLVSPGRGLFVWSPWTIGIAAGAAALALDWRRLRSARGGSAARDAAPDRGQGASFLLSWRLAHAAFIAASLAALAAYPAWSGGWSVGPRLQSDWLLSGALLAAPAWTWLTRRRLGLALLALAILPSAWLHARAMTMTGDLFEAKNPDHPTRLWDLRLGGLHWIASEGRIERELRGETREPLLSAGNNGVWLFDPADPEGERWFRSGVAVAASPDGRRFETTARAARLLFAWPEGEAPPGDLLLAFELHDPPGAEPGLVRRIEAEFNGTTVGAVRFVTGSGGRPLVATVPAGLVRRGEANEIALRDRRPPPGTFFRETPLRFTARVVDANSAAAERIREAAVRFDERANGR